jgi:hypothetical protein
MSALQELLPASPGRFRKRILRILVPVDLRRFYPTPTLRNFFGFVAPEIDTRFGRLSRAAIAHEVRWLSRGGLSEHRLRALFSRNAQDEFFSLLTRPVSFALCRRWTTTEASSTDRR